MGDHLKATGTTGMVLDNSTTWRRVGSLLFWPLNDRSIICWSISQVERVLNIQLMPVYASKLHIIHHRRIYRLLLV